MKDKTLLVGIIAVVILGAGVVRYSAQKTSVTPGPLVTPSEQTSPSMSAVGTSTNAKATSTPAPTIPPSTKIALSISSPSNGATVTKSSLKVKGKTTAGAEVFVNELETKADADGNFSVSITLDEGENFIIVMANDASGNVAEAELTVTYNP